MIWFFDEIVARGCISKNTPKHHCHKHPPCIRHITCDMTPNQAIMAETNDRNHDNQCDKTILTICANYGNYRSTLKPVVVFRHVFMVITLNKQALQTKTSLKWSGPDKTCLQSSTKYVPSMNNANHEVTQPWAVFSFLQDGLEDARSKSSLRHSPTGKKSIPWPLSFQLF